MEIWQRVLLTNPEKECHKGKTAVIVKKLISDAGVALYRVKIEGHQRMLPRWATDEDIQLVR